MIAAERMELLEFLGTLSAKDWLVPSLCEGWRVRDVVAHLLWDNVSVGRYFWVVGGLASTVGGGWTSRTRPNGILADQVVHHQDIRRPLGRLRTIEPARLRRTLQKPNPFTPRAVRGRGRPRR
jgi:hypothetical protein